MKKHILLLFLFAIPFFAQAQTAIEAKITDSNNNPVPFANIYLPDSKKSTTSNEDGDFYLIINPEIDKTVIISHLSYEDVQLKINKDFPKKIVLKDGVLQLEDLIIGNRLSGHDIALKVVENLKKNHDIDPAYYKYFTRIVQYTEDWDTINLVQEYYGVLRHNDNHNTKMNVKKSRMVPYNPAGEEALKTGLTISLWGIRGDNLFLYKPDFLKKSKLRKYEISIEGSTNLNGIDCYILKYTNDDADYSDEKKAMAYIDKETYGIVKVITTYNENDNIYMERNFVNINNKWVLSSATEKLHTYKITSTLYNYLTNEDDYADIDFTRTPFWEKLKKFNKDPDDIFWDNYQHIPLPKN